MSYDRLLPLLLKNSLVQLRETRPPTTLPLGYDVNASHVFHFGAPGHTLEDCKGFKYKVHDLIDSKATAFTSNGLNILYHPMPPYEGTSTIPRLVQR